jgi:LPS export ABC transporter protein LptC
MNRSAVLVAFILALSVAGGAALYFSGQQTQKAAQQASQSNSKKTEASKETAVGQNVSFTFTESGRKKWEMMVEVAHYDHEGTEAELTGVKGQFYNPDGKILATFAAPKGHYNGESNQFRLTGGVVIEGKSDDAMNLTGDTLDWGSGQAQITVSGNVVVTTPDSGRSTAQRCQFTPDFRYIQLSGGTATVLAM